jgi:thiol peroxidase
MSTITLKGAEVHTNGTLPAVGTIAPDFNVAKTDLSNTSLKDFAGKKILLNIFPSIDTGICAASTRRFNKDAATIPNVVVLCVSKDLPQAHKRFCEAEGISGVIATSAIRDDSFEKGYGVKMIDGKMAGFLSRAIVVIGEDGKIKYTEQVPEIAQDPNYEAALGALK